MQANYPSGPAYAGQGYGGGAAPPPNYGGPYANNTIEADAFLGGTSNFSDIKIRHAFIRKVYGIIAFQLAITIAIGSVIMFVSEVNRFFYTNPGLLWLFVIGMIKVSLLHRTLSRLENFSDCCVKFKYFFNVL